MIMDINVHVQRTLILHEHTLNYIIFSLLLALQLFILIIVSLIVIM